MIVFDTSGESPWNALIQCPCFTNEEVWAQRGQVSFLGSHSIL